MLKKLIPALLGLVVNGFAYSGTMGPMCTPGVVTVACDFYWDFDIQALYLQSEFDNDKAYQNVVGTPDSFQDIHNDWDWGSRLAGSYHFYMGNDITINWTHYKSHANQDALAGFLFISPTTVLSNQPFNLVSRNTFDQVNSVMGQYVDFSQCKKMRFYAGLQYAHIQTDGTNYFSFTSTIPSVTSISQFTVTDYKGVGPTVGMDYWYYLTNRFSLTTSTAASVLVGKSRYSAGYVGAPFGAVFSSVNGTRNAIVPSVEARLGMNYVYDSYFGTFNIEGGYQAVNYFNAIQSQGQALITTGLLTDSDYGLYGPYIGLRYIGTV
ncbi:MAG: hypothetical protein H0U75_11470 [Legionella sp.]|nr:hypothetical protein [Legionella sp.]